MSMKRIGAWLLCIFLVAGLFSFSVHLAGHDCETEHCSVCETIALLRILCMTIPAAVASSLLFSGITHGCVPAADPAAALTLVSLKIRLDN